MTSEKPRRRWSQISLRTLFVLVTALFAFVPLAFIGYAAIGGIVGGLVVVCGLMLVQWPLFAILIRRLPREPR